MGQMTPRGVFFAAPICFLCSWEATLSTGRYNAASYILEKDNPIEDGETIDGIENGQMCREVQWKCRYEDALIQPPRGVLDIHMGEFAAGRR